MNRFVSQESQHLSQTNKAENEKNEKNLFHNFLHPPSSAFRLSDTDLTDL